MMPFRELELEGNGFHQLHKGKDSLLDIIKSAGVHALGRSRFGKHMKSPTLQE